MRVSSVFESVSGVCLFSHVVGTKIVSLPSSASTLTWLTADISIKKTFISKSDTPFPDFLGYYKYLLDKDSSSAAHLSQIFCSL